MFILLLGLLLAVIFLAALLGLLRSMRRGREGERQVLEMIGRNLDRMEARMANLETIVVGGREEGAKEAHG